MYMYMYVTDGMVYVYKHNINTYIDFNAVCKKAYEIIFK